jgi:hypothetical protein|tara:strand:+ start:267 stop:410 length:144 start_codon:yes stop_codon:yes gene_type:complete
MALESQWNSMYTITGIYTVEMKAIEKRIDEIKSQLVIADIQKAKSSS